MPMFTLVSSSFSLSDCSPDSFLIHLSMDSSIPPEFSLSLTSWLAYFHPIVIAQHSQAC